MDKQKKRWPYLALLLAGLAGAAAYLGLYPEKANFLKEKAGEAVERAKEKAADGALDELVDKAKETLEEEKSSD